MTFWRSEHPEATRELLNAIRFYEEQAHLGEDFAHSSRVAITDVIGDPDAWHPLSSQGDFSRIRGRRIGAYPYKIIYYRRGNEVVIIAYAHEKRHPGYWRHRLSE